MKTTVIFILSLIFLSACNKEEPKNAADMIFYGGDILTMEGTAPQYVEAVAVKDGKIIFAGLKSDAEKLKGSKTEMKDLEGKTLIPGFVDGHSHLLTYADATVQADLNPPPVGKINKIADIISALKELKQKINLNDTDLLIGWGYDQDFLEEKRHPNADELDAAFPSNPVILIHTSGHMLVANSKAFKLAGINSETPDPTGGTFIRKTGSRELEGLVQEMAMQPFIPFTKKPLSAEIESKKLKDAQEYYASCGVTTAAEHLVMPEKMPVLEKMMKDKTLYIDLVATPAFIMAKELIGTGKIKWGEYNNHVKYGGIKMAVDGSPQGKTAFLTKPYLTPVPGCTHDCKGFSNMTQEQINELFLQCYKNNIQIYSHCNGDASVDMMIKAHEYAVNELKDNNKDRRTVIVHSQIMRPDQMEAYKKYGLFPSFFTNHTYYWGDVHNDNLGTERANYLSPMKSAFDMSVKCTDHTDCTVTPMDQLFLLWSAVNRLSRNGKVIGPDQRISPYQGLLSLTIYGAYEYFEENTKGSIKEGKMADLVILDNNPVKVDPLTIKDIKVIETYKEGKSIFKKK